MKQRSYKNTNLIAWIVIILGFSFLYFSYFFIYIPKQEDQLKQRAFRILKEYGSNITAKQNYYKNHFNNYAPFYGIRHFGFQKVSEDDINDSVEVQEVINGLFDITTKSVMNNNKNMPDFFQNDGSRFFLQFHNDIKAKDCKKIEHLIDKDSLNLLINQDLLTNVPVRLFMDGLKFDQLFENIILLSDSMVYYNSNDEVQIDINNPVALFDSIAGIQGGTYLKLDIRGEDKHVMILPFRFIGTELYLAGFIPDNVFQNITRTINNQLLIFLAGILMLIFIGMPVLKVIFLSSNERLKSADASSSVFSLVLGTGLLILLTISFVKQQFSDGLYSRNRIEMVSDSLYSNVMADIYSIKDLYRTINNLALERSQSAGKDKQSFSDYKKTLLSLVDSHFLGTKNSFQDTLLNSVSKFYQDPGLKSPFPLNEILLINNSGKIAKAITRTPFSDVVEIDLSERNYFRNIEDTTLSWISKDNFRYYIESIQSYNTGKGETAVSFYTTAFDSKIPVLAITSVIPSLYYQVLPKDVEFLVMNDKGKVLYHSIRSKNLHENFLEECESDYRLVKAIDLRIEDKFQLNYNGKKWLARILPVEDTPLYHITLIDQSLANNKNARVFLFSFYFFVASLFLLMIGILVKRLIFPVKKKQDDTWFLNWLDFRDENSFLYPKLIGLLILSVIMQVVGIFILEKPLAILFYQFFFMIYAIYISMLVLKQRKVSNKNFVYGILFILIILLVQILLSGHVDLMKKLVFLGIVFLSVVYVTDATLKNLQGDKKRADRGLKTKQNHYVLFMFLLLANLSVVPVIQFYFSVKSTEDRLWRQEQLFKVANDNLLLHSEYNDHDASWFKRIQGNNVDNIRVAYEPAPYESADRNRMTNSDRIYSHLFDPITRSYFPGELFKGKNFTNEWEAYDSLKFSKAGREGRVSATFSGKAGVDYLQLILVILIVCILIFGLIWLLLNYLTSAIFNLHPEEKPRAGDMWHTVLSDPVKKHILLKAFNGDCYFRKSADFLYGNNKKPGARAKHLNPRPVYVSQIIDDEVKLQEVLKSQPVIWLSGLDNYIYQIEKHELLLSAIMKLNQYSEQKVIVDLPFDIELISEYYEEYISENELEPENTAQLYILRKRWNDIFRHYYEYFGYVDFDTDNNDDNSTLKGNTDNVNIEECIQEVKDDPGLWFKVIWANLTSKEKIILYDLADDGLLNRKNKDIISRLIRKKLIIPKNGLALFSTDFREFVLKQLTPSKIKTIERDLGIKGQWRNIRYLILLILIPLGAFIFMSQGISMEKIFGIIGGAIAAITALLRLFDSSTFKQQTS